MEKIGFKTDMYQIHDVDANREFLKDNNLFGFAIVEKILVQTLKEIHVNNSGVNIPHIMSIFKMKLMEEDEMEEHEKMYITTTITLIQDLLYKAAEDANIKRVESLHADI